MVLGFIPLIACAWVADRTVSLSFRLARITEERWSIFNTRRSRRPG